MVPSMEVRWFYQDKIPPQVIEWFQVAVAGAETDGSRVDYYFPLADLDSLSMKLRQGNVEIKWRTKEYGVIQLGDGITGYKEQWHKWSFLLDDKDSESRTIISSDPKLESLDKSWIGVQKDRMLRVYEIIDKDQAKPIPHTTHVAQGCQVELTSITAEGKSWWSFGFEAWGVTEEDLEKNLHVGSQLVLAGTAPTALDAKDSYSYPKWIRTLSVSML